MHRHPPSTIGPDDLKSLIEELVTPFRAKPTATQASGPLPPTPTDAALASQLAPGVANADNAPAIDADVTTVTTAWLPDLTMSTSRSMMVYPSIESPDVNMVNTSAINASSADTQAVGRNAGALDGVVPITSTGKSPVLPVTIPAAPCSLDTPSSMLPPAVTSQCHKPLFGQPSALCGSMASPLHSDGTFPALFGQGNAASGIPSVSRFSCPPAPWGYGPSSFNQAENLSPSFEFLQYFDNKWVVRLRFGGHEVSKLQSYPTKAAAAADACRGGLATLKGLMPLWVVPESPVPGVSPNRLRWNSLLTYPVYTQYSNFDGYRNEVEVDGLSFFGVEKCYPSIDEAIIGCAHKALHHLLVTGGANEELMYRVAKSGALPKVVGATPILPNKPEPVTVDLTKFPFVPSAGTSVIPKRARRKGGRGRGKEASLVEVTNAFKKAKGSERQHPHAPIAASATGANSVKVKAVEDTTNKKSTGKLVTPTFFNPSLMAQKPSTNPGVPDAAEFAQAIFFQCRMSGNRSTCRKDPCTASEFRLKLKSYGSDLLRVKIAFLMEVMMGVNQLRGGNWIEEAALTDKTGFYL
ncbi:hypothetical protein TEQG_08853 [Trichophyton equinum CBS 127.97]|uniref:Uncharacterized protein n=1 Tax=Trichophyton equinum (strain ATCC MYA-4606 / CBS 127.97) TaxID=559882 RepID=F2Q5S6_TRIEC|nr:hypothetical protein TEQG_08853 [Trichophyton equinum CBS 127.97]